MFRKWGIVALTTALVASSSLAFAADAVPAQQGALSAGKPAGVHQAQSEFWTKRKLLWTVGAGVVIGGVVYAATGNGNGTTTTSTTRTAQPGH